jgi:hypothetical protein
MRTKLLFLIFVFLSLGAGMSFAQVPSFKVDFNIGSRTESQVNDPNFLPWAINTVKQSSDTIQGVVVKIVGFKYNRTDTIAYSANWYKAGISTSNDALLTCDGVQDTVIQMTIHGLPAGTNTLLTYHNDCDGAYSSSSTTGKTFNPIKIIYNNNVVDSLMPTDRVTTLAGCAISYLTFKVDSGEDAVFWFVPVKISGHNPLNSVTINGFEVNTPNSLHQAYYPYPTDRNEHSNGDLGTITLTWNKALTAASHNLYFGTDSTTVTNATPSSSVFKGNRNLTDTTYTVAAYDMNRYFWRVDEIDSVGTITKGNTWYYRIRHLAFPEAEGYGRFAMGGRGGDVVHVTSLDDDSIPGDFRYAVTTSNGPRTVVFDVSGIIYLKSRLVMNSDITIAGQTAPGKGICFRAAPIGVSSDCICRFIRLRLGHGTTYDGMGMAGVDNGIIDHCSISWTIDESFSSRNANNITLQRTNISEALNVAGHDNYPPGTAHGYAGSIGGNVGSFHHNLLAHNEGRNWSMAGGLDGNGYYAGKLDIFNMVVYNWGSRANDGGCYEGNFVNNYYRRGPATSWDYVMNAQLQGAGLGTQSYYYSGNIETQQDGTAVCDGTDNSCGSIYSLSGGQVLNWTVFVNQPFFPSYATIESAKDAYKSVLSDAGCNQPILDDHDKRIVKETQNGTYTYKGSVSGLPGLIDSELDAGGYENYPQENRPSNFDTDGDGLPDWWENIIGTNPNSASGDFSDANADPDGDGYTNLENYLNWMSYAHYDAVIATPLKIDLGQYTVGYTSSPNFSFPSKTNCSVSMIAGTDTALVVPLATGLANFTYTVTDAEGSSMTRTVNLHVTSNTTTGLSNASIKTLSVYPNPTNDKIYISGFESNQSNNIFYITNTNGQIVMAKKISSGSDDTITIDVSNLNAGVYIISTNNNSAIGRFVKQ